MKKPLPNNAMILVKPDELVLESGYQVREKGGGRQERVLSGYPVKKKILQMSIHARCEFFKSSHVI